MANLRSTSRGSSIHDPRAVDRCRYWARIVRDGKETAESSDPVNCTHCLSLTEDPENQKTRAHAALTMPREPVTQADLDAIAQNDRAKRADPDTNPYRILSTQFPMSPNQIRAQELTEMGMALLRMAFELEKQP